jgi:hypothetical protein
MAARIVDALSHPSARGKVDGKREDDTTSRWLVQKRTYFKGNYDRVLTISSSAIGTQMPNLQGTNLYSLSPEFNVKSVTFEKDCLTVNAKPDAKVCFLADRAASLRLWMFNHSTGRTEEPGEVDGPLCAPAGTRHIALRSICLQCEERQQEQGHADSVRCPTACSHCVHNMLLGRGFAVAVPAETLQPLTAASSFCVFAAALVLEPNSPARQGIHDASSDTGPQGRLQQGLVR